jgi:hypothetical protein
MIGLTASINSGDLKSIITMPDYAKIDALVAGIAAPVQIKPAVAELNGFVRGFRESSDVRREFFLTIHV